MVGAPSRRHQRLSPKNHAYATKLSIGRPIDDINVKRMVLPIAAGAMNCLQAMRGIEGDMRPMLAGFNVPDFPFGTRFATSMHPALSARQVKNI